MPINSHRKPQALRLLFHPVPTSAPLLSKYLSDPMCGCKWRRLGDPQIPTELQGAHPIRKHHRLKQNRCSKGTRQQVGLKPRGRQQSSASPQHQAAPDALFLYSSCSFRARRLLTHRRSRRARTPRRTRGPRAPPSPPSWPPAAWSLQESKGRI